MHPSLTALRASLSTCSDLFQKLGVAPDVVGAARAELDALALNVDTSGQFDDGDSVH